MASSGLRPVFPSFFKGQRILCHFRQSIADNPLIFLGIPEFCQWNHVIPVYHPIHLSSHPDQMRYTSGISHGGNLES